MQLQDKRLFRKKHPRYGEIAIEWSIRVVSSASVLVIALIFLFVLREAAGIFNSGTEEKPTLQAVEPKPAEQSEVYNPDTASDSTVLLAADDLKPEIYNPDSGEETITSTIATLPAVSQTAKSIWQNLAGENWQPISEQPKFGIAPLIIGTVKTTFIAIAVAAPLGILAAMYVALFTRRRLREIIKPFIEILAGFPSVVIGFFCLMTIASILQNIFGFDYRLNSIVGGIGLAITVVPIIFTITEDALSAVPKSYREAALALGATEWEIAFKLMLPAALPGVIAAVLLGIGRAFGETMIALMATGNAPLSEWNLAMPARTLAATIGAEMGEVIWGSTHYSVLFFLGALLFMVSFAINLLTEVFVRRRLAKKFQGS